MVFSVFSAFSVAQLPTLVQNFPSSQTHTSYPLSNHLHFLQPRALATSNQLSVWFYLFCITAYKRNQSQINYVTFGAWLLSLCTMFSRFVHVLVCTNTSALLQLTSHWTCTPQCVHPPIPMGSWMVPTLWLLWVTPPQTLMSKFPYRRALLSLGTYPGVELLITQ